MEEGIIFTQDKKDIEVFFLKPQSPARQRLDAFPQNWYDHLNEQDVNENSAGGGAHELNWGEKGCSPCPVGHKGHQGVQGSNLSVYEAILEVLKSFEDTQLNMASETAREILAMAIERKIKNYLP